ncbi:MAG TPA: glutamate--tRNA ligase family protein, partial [Candidatus Elarobacter sp.]|nr:glutamate--tRNA ligase family protein [Candidatus Elarobacter sp.]
MDRLLDRPLRVRSVPSVSPSGSVSVAAARLALFNWLIARRSGGTLVVRVADADRERGIDDAVVRDLQWLGLTGHEGAGSGV